MDPYFVDIHVLGDSAEQVKAAVNTWRRHIKAQMANGEGDVVGRAGDIKAPEAPLPKQGLTCSAGAVFDAKTPFNADDEFERALKKITAMPGVTAALTVWWLMGDETAHLLSANPQGQLDRRMISGGQVFEDAQADDQLVDTVGDLLLPQFLNPAPSSLAPLYARQRAFELEQVLPRSGATQRAKPRA